jgi:hypothetical protein
MEELSFYVVRAETYKQGTRSVASSVRESVKTGLEPEAEE